MKKKKVIHGSFVGDNELPCCHIKGKNLKVVSWDNADFCKGPNPTCFFCCAKYGRQ